MPSTPQSRSLARSAAARLTNPSIETLPPYLFDTYITPRLGARNLASAQRASKGLKNQVGTALEANRFGVQKVVGKIVTRLRQAMSLIERGPRTEAGFATIAQTLKRKGWKPYVPPPTAPPLFASTAATEVPFLPNQPVKIVMVNESIHMYIEQDNRHLSAVRVWRDVANGIPIWRMVDQTPRRTAHDAMLKQAAEKAAAAVGVQLTGIF